MSDRLELPPVHVLILVRLLASGEKGDKTSKLRKDLEPWLGHRWSGAVLTDVLDRALEALETAGLVAAAPKPARAKKTDPAFLLTPEGRKRGLEVLKVDQLPPKATWATLKKGYLPAVALNLPALDEKSRKTFSSDGGFKAALLKEQFGLSLNGCPTLAQATDALAWKLIGFESAEKFSAPAVQKALFHKALGDQAARPAEAKKSVDLLLSRRVGARRGGGDGMREAVLRGWIDQSPPARDDRVQTVPGLSPTPEPAPPSSPAPLDLEHFARTVVAAARACATGRFGDNKVFIIHVWRSLQDDPAFRAMGLAAFKHRLAEANNARLLDLSRADLVQAMDPEDVRLSEVNYLNASFHFIRIGSER